MQQALNAAQTQGSSEECSIDQYLYTHGCPPVDLLVRTSGEQRLSDFMLRQSSHALLVFTGVLWPDFGFLDLVSAIIQYQKRYTTLQAAKHAGEASVAQLMQQRRREQRCEQQEKNASTPRVVVTEQLISLKLPVGIEFDSPCSVATPGSGSSPSSRSEGSNRSTELSVFEKELLAVQGEHGTACTAGSGGVIGADVPLSYTTGVVRRRIAAEMN
jgi:hypothetical protein